VVARGQHAQLEVEHEDAGGQVGHQGGELLPLVGENLPGPLGGRHVEVGARKTNGLARLVAARDAPAVEDVHPRPVGVLHPVDVFVPRRAPLDVRLNVPVRPGQIVGMNPRLPGLQVHLRGGRVEPDHFAPAVIKLHGVVAEIPVPDAEARAVEGQVQPVEQLRVRNLVEEFPQLAHRHPRWSKRPSGSSVNACLHTLRGPSCGGAHEG
jgi:hypothetical protein